MSFVFVRHAESIGNLATQDERAGWDIPNHEYPLTERGKAQADIVGRALAQEYGPDFFDMAFDTDFLRSAQTLDAFLPHLEPKKLVRLTDSRLNEKWDGIFHELPRSEIAERYPDQLRMKKRAGYYLYRPPGGESCPDVEVRIRSFLADYLSLVPWKNILVVGHGRWFLIFQKVLYGWSIEKLLEKKKERCDNCTVAAFSSQALTYSLPPAVSVPWQGKLPDIPTEHA